MARLKKYLKEKKIEVYYVLYTIKDARENLYSSVKRQIIKKYEAMYANLEYHENTNVLECLQTAFFIKTSDDVVALRDSIHHILIEESKSKECQVIVFRACKPFETQGMSDEAAWLEKHLPNFEKVKP